MQMQFDVLSKQSLGSEMYPCFISMNMTQPVYDILRVIILSQIHLAAILCTLLQFPVAGVIRKH